MRKANLLSSIVLVLASLHGTGEVAAKTGKEPPKDLVQDEKERLVIRVAPGDWGGGDPAQIEVLLNSVGREMLKHFPGRRSLPIQVSPSTQGPLVMYQKGPSNEYQILLAAKDEHWAEYVYEFSHELLHILAGYDVRPPAHAARHQWFEEMLCEAASLYMLKRYALSWDELAPRPQWQGYASTLQRFTHRALSEKHRRLQAHVKFEDWFREHGPELATRPYLREKNELVAMMFLPLLEQLPDWRAIEYLNLGNSGNAPGFHDYLARWYQKTPAAQRQLVTSTFNLFRLPLPMENAELTADPLRSDLRGHGSVRDDGTPGVLGP